VKVIWLRDKGILTIGEETFFVFSEVRNELNGRRKLGIKGEVVRAVVNGQEGPPYMPRPFPKGLWEITGIEIIADQKSEFYPVKIRTNASQLVNVWELDKSGGYAAMTDREVIDSGYHLHWTPSKTTWGCGRIGSIPEALYIASRLWAGEHQLEVL